MIEKTLVLKNRLGLHARAAAKLVHTAAHYSSRITLSKDGEDVDGKSILGLLLLAAGAGRRRWRLRHRGRALKPPGSAKGTGQGDDGDEGGGALQNEVRTAVAARRRRPSQNVASPSGLRCWQRPVERHRRRAGSGGFTSIKGAACARSDWISDMNLSEII